MIDKAGEIFEVMPVFRPKIKRVNPEEVIAKNEGLKGTTHIMTKAPLKKDSVEKEILKVIGPNFAKEIGNEIEELHIKAV